MIAIIDYGVGNLFSLEQSLKAIGQKAIITGEASALYKADHVILPGVGAFGDAARRLKESGLDRVIVDLSHNGRPILGICLGMQLLFETSLEFGTHKGLDLIPGVVRPISKVIPQGLKVPHIGWNSLVINRAHPLLKDVKQGEFVYFVHSYYACTGSLRADPERHAGEMASNYRADSPDTVLAYTEYGAPLTAAVARGSVCGCQFHPEKSGDTGLRILKAFCEWDGVDL
ncbi:MAG: imidazole glycerol phosphate synthase subunit HisH [Clostridia bacterium]|nr:imidazole glycerol phosphate synthase subunit HisH [Clostridia bacterium]